MADATTKPSALDALKPHDGTGHSVGFSAYYAKHVATYDEQGRRLSGATLSTSRGATERRKAATCELAGIDAAEYDRRAEPFVAKLLARHPDLVGGDSVRDHALAFCSHAALAQARAKAAPAAADASVTSTLAPEPRAVPHAARAAGPRGPRKVGVDPNRARAAVLVREISGALAVLEARLFRAGRVTNETPRGAAA